MGDTDTMHRIAALIQSCFNITKMISKSQQADLLLFFLLYVQIKAKNVALKRKHLTPFVVTSEKTFDT